VVVCPRRGRAADRRRRFGLSYTTFELSDLEVSPVSADGALTAHVTVTNTGAVAGATVVQLYVGVPADDITHPLLQLRGFAKAKGLAPGAKTTVKIALDRLAFAYWDEPKAQWRARRGEYVLKVGQSSEDLPLVTKVKVEKTLTWNGV
jgi:beta-glucosidase